MQIIRLTAITTLIACQPLAAEVPAPSESAVELSASKLLPAELLRGPSHRVREQVATDGYMAHFVIDSDFGVFEAVGVPQLSQRINEVVAIRKLVETSKSDLFAEGMKRSLTQPVDAVKNIAQDPVNSLKRAPKTVGHFFSKVGASVERGAHRIKEGGADSGTPSQVGNAAKNAAGFDKAKLDAAKQLGVDPYTDNARLQEEMDKVTWAFFAGGLPLRIGAAVVSAGVAVAATEMVGVPEETYALTQSELALRDQRSLAAMGLKEGDIKDFQIQPSLSTTRRHRIVKALEALPGAAGRGRVILLANSCETSDQADFLIEGLSVLARRQLDGVANYKELHVFGRLVGATTAAGTLEVPAPVNHVTWTEQVAAFATRDDLGALPKTLVHTGAFSDAATAGFNAAGWTLVATPYPGG